jgi:hypothetical protein
VCKKLHWFFLFIKEFLLCMIIMIIEIW